MSKPNLHPRRPATWSGLMIGMIVIGLGGCGFQSPFVANPSVTVEAGTVRQITAEGIRADVLVTLSNPNSVPLRLTRAQYTTTIAGFDSYSTNLRPNASIPAEGEIRLTLPAVFDTDTPVQSITTANFETSGYFTYQPPGELRQLMTDLAIPLPSSLFSGGGQIALTPYTPNTPTLNTPTPNTPTPNTPTPNTPTPNATDTSEHNPAPPALARQSDE